MVNTKLQLIYLLSLSGIRVECVSIQLKNCDLFCYDN